MELPACGNKRRTLMLVELILLSMSLLDLGEARRPALRWSRHAQNTNGSIPWGSHGVYAFGLTVAEVETSSEDGRVVECKLTELQDPLECDVLVRKIGRPVVNVCFERMMELISDCRNLVYTAGQVVSANLGTTPYWNPAWKGIYPGTKWCGPGDIANGYADLGADAALDKCCRAHDHCPVKLKAFRRGHGLTNFSLYTKSHCDCDRDFLECLLKSESDNAGAIGNMYFNVLRIQCVREVDKAGDKCRSAPNSVSKECQHADQRHVFMKFVNSEKPYPLAALSSANA